MLFQRHDQKRLSLITLGSLHDRGQGAVRRSAFLRVLDELVLLEEVLHGSLLPLHFVLEDLDFCLQLHILLLMSICYLFELQNLLLELLRHFTAGGRVR